VITLPFIFYVYQKWQFIKDFLNGDKKLSSKNNKNSGLTFMFTVFEELCLESPGFDHPSESGSASSCLCTYYFILIG